MNQQPKAQCTDHINFHSASMNIEHVSDWESNPGLKTDNADC